MYGLRLLLHDIGHGPFCHFFDHHFLQQFGLTHEIVGTAHHSRSFRRSIIRNIQRSPSGSFSANGEQLNPEHIAFLILKDPHQSTKGISHHGSSALRPLLGGIFTPDNCDYVLRDSYMCGVAIGPVDIDRLLHYTFFSTHGLTIHQAWTFCASNVPTCHGFISTPMSITIGQPERLISIFKKYFQPTLQLLFPDNPLKRLSRYLHLTDWHVTGNGANMAKISRR